MTPLTRASNLTDPLAQQFTVKTADGSPLSISLAYVNEWQTEVVVTGICQGVQIGAASLLLLLLFLITKADKRRSVLFMLNALALLLVVIRSVFFCIVFTGPFYEWYRSATHYYAGTDPYRAISVCCQLSNFVLIAVLEVALVFQVRIVCCTLEPHWRYLVNGTNSLIALLEVFMNFAFAVLAINWNILGVENETAWQINRLSQLAKATNILLVVSIGTSTAIFCAKLAFAIRARRSMGMTQFGPMQIIFIMGCQTMCIPFIFLLIAFYGLASSMVQTFVPTVVACSLPLSGMWAAANTTNAHIADPDPRHRGAIPFGLVSQCGRGYGASSKTATTVTTMSSTLFEEGGGATRLSPTDSVRPLRGSKKDVEMQKLGEGVHVDRTYSVRSD